MIDRWRKMTPGERLRAQVVVGFLVLGLYGLVFYPASYSQHAEIEKLISRRKNRIETRTSLENVGQEGRNPKIIEREIAQVEEELKEASQAFHELDMGFAPVESSEVRQQLMLELSNLSARSGIELVSISRKGVSPEGEVIGPQVDPELGRPLLVLTANAQFGNLMDFLHGLKDLSFYTSVMNIKVYSMEWAKENKIIKQAGTSPGALFVSLEVSI